MSEANPKARRKGLLVEELPTELLVYDQKNHRAHCLNASAASIFKSADGTMTLAELARAASDRLGAPFSEDLALLALEELDKNDLLETPLPMAAQGPSRRDFVKLGAASAVLVPLVMAITAPTPAYAQSAPTGPTGLSGKTGATGPTGPIGGGSSLPTGATGATGP